MGLLTSLRRCIWPLFVFSLIFLEGCGNQPETEVIEENDLSGVIAGQKLPATSVRSVITSAGFPAKAINRMICTAWFESNWHTRSRNKNRNGSIDFGLLQINQINWKWCKVNQNSLADANVNARCGYKIFKSQGLNAWYGYRNHKRRCDSYKSGRLALDAEADDPTTEEQILNGDGSDPTAPIAEDSSELAPLFANDDVPE